MKRVGAPDQGKNAVQQQVDAVIAEAQKQTAKKQQQVASEQGSSVVEITHDPDQEILPFWSKLLITGAAIAAAVAIVMKVRRP